MSRSTKDFVGCRRDPDRGVYALWVASVALSLAVGGVPGCGCEEPSSADLSANQSIETPKENTMGTTLLISKIVDGQDWQIGTLAFDNSQDPILTIQSEGDHGEHLREAWAELSQLETLPLEYRENIEVDGKEMVDFKADLVAPDDARYPNAVWSYLESKYGFLVDQQL